MTFSRRQAIALGLAGIGSTGLGIYARPVSAAPLKIEHGTGSPIRALALVPKS